MQSASGTSGNGTNIDRPHRVYCAGPLFNQAERDEMTSIADVLCHAGFAVYLPHRDGMEFRHIHHILVEQGWPPPTAAHFLHEAIFALDIFQLIEECDSVVWNLNGRTPDEGAVSEAAIAWALGMPLVAYKDDVRSLITGRDNPLLAGLVGFRTLDDPSKIPQALQAAIDGAASTRKSMGELPPKVREASAQGRRLWTVMQERGPQGDNAAIAGAVTQLFAGQPTAEFEKNARCNTP
jgi:nucleoside 2-deoxyribosyltransferase